MYMRGMKHIYPFIRASARIKAAYGRVRTRNALSRFVPQRFVAFIGVNYI